MAITFIKERKRQKFLTLIALGAVAVAFIIFWFGYFKKEKPLPPSTTPIAAYREIQIDLNVLGSPLLKQFQPFEKILPYEDGMGRDNPFLP